MPIDIMLRNCIFAATTQQFLNMDVSIYNRIVCCTSVAQKWFWSSVRSIGSYGFSYIKPSIYHDSVSWLLLY